MEIDNLTLFEEKLEKRCWNDDSRLILGSLGGLKKFSQRFGTKCLKKRRSMYNCWN